MSRTASLPDVLAQIDAFPTPKGVDSATFTRLAADLRRLLQARAEGKTVSSAPTGAQNAVTDLSAAASPAGDRATVIWREVLPGDYDNNGVVDIADLIPVVLYYGQRTDSGPEDAHRLVQGDSNAVINEGDLPALAANYAAHLEGYQVWRGHWNGNSTDWESTFRPNTANPANASWTVDRPSPPPLSMRPAYAYTDELSGAPDRLSVRYKVVAHGDGAAGAESNVAAMRPQTFFSISGNVTLFPSGAPLSGVAMTISPAIGYGVTSQPDGTYKFPSVLANVYTLTPSKAGFWFSPPTRTIVVTQYDVTGADFTASPAGLSSTSPWPKFMRNAANTGYSPYPGPTTNAVKWSPWLGGAIRSAPVIAADGTIYVGCDDANLYALRPLDGSVIWRTPVGGPVSSSPAIGADGTIFVGSGDYKVYALSPIDGSIRWARPTQAPVNSSPSIGADGTIYIGSQDFSVYALNPGDGSVKWSYKTGAEVVSSPAIGPDGTIYVGSRDWKVYALNPADGSVRWTRRTSSTIQSSPALGANGALCIGSEDGNVYLLDQATGNIRWSYNTWMPVRSSPAIGADGTVYVGNAGGTVRAFDPTSGNLLWLRDTFSPIVASPAVASNGLVYFSTGSQLVALNRGDGSLRWSLSGAFTSPAISSDATIYAGSPNWGIYAVGGTAEATWDIIGKVTYLGVGIQYVFVTLTPSGTSKSTSVGGRFDFPGLTDGTYTVTPASPDFTFTPASRDVTISGATVEGVDFVATPTRTYNVSGKVTDAVASAGVPGVVLTLAPGGQNATTETDGTYVITGVGNLTYTLTPSNGSYYFSPLSRQVTVNGSDRTGQDFTAYSYSLADSAWPKFRGNSRNTGLSPYLGPQTNNIKWKCPTGYIVTSSPAIGSDGTVYVGCDGLYAINPSDGSLKWKSATGYSVYSSPAISTEGTVYIGSLDGNLHAVNSADGSVKWSCPVASPSSQYFFSSPAVGADGTIYVGSEDNGVYAINPGDGSVRWRYLTGNPVRSSPAVAPDGTIYIYSTDGLYAFNPTDGSVKWKCAAVGGWFSAPAVGTDGTIYVESSAVNPANGSVKWTTSIGASSSPAIGAEGTIYVGVTWSAMSGTMGLVYALSPTDGSVIWSRDLWVAPVMSSPAVGADGTIYVGCDSGSVYCLDPADGSIKWTCVLGDWFRYVRSSPAIGSDGSLYVGAWDNYVCAIGP